MLYCNAGIVYVGMYTEMGEPYVTGFPVILKITFSRWLVNYKKGLSTFQIAMAKVVVARMACRVIDRAIQVHGGMGVSQDSPLAYMYSGARSLRIADGPDEVHMETIAKLELKNHLKARL